MVVAKKWVLVKPFEGSPVPSNFELQEEDLPPLKNKDVLFEAQYLSVDPYMRFFPVPVGVEMCGEQVAKVIESKHPNYKVGSLYVCEFGWRTHTLINPDDPGSMKVTMWFGYNRIRPIPELNGLNQSLALGVAGMTGATAHIALLRLGEPKRGETVLVNAATGAVGSTVGQIAKILGCRVIGFAGSEDKIKALKQLGFDYAYNYKTCNLQEALKEAAPNGVNVFFDNVGGAFANTVLEHGMAHGGRVVVVGGLSGYTATTPQTGPYNYPFILGKCLKVEGFLIMTHPLKSWYSAISDLVRWTKQGLVKSKENVANGFDQVPNTLIGLLRGDFTGKAVVKP